MDIRSSNQNLHQRIERCSEQKILRTITSVAFSSPRPLYICAPSVRNSKQYRNFISFSWTKKMINMATMNASAKDDDPNFLYVKRRTADDKYHTLAKLDPREFDGGETLHVAALRLCKSAFTENPTGAALVVSLKKPLGGLEITWFYNHELTISMLRTICNSAYGPEFDMEDEEDEDEVGNNGGA